jgi:hypothetical protein
MSSVTALPAEAARPADSCAPGRFEVDYLTREGAVHGVALEYVWAAPLKDLNKIGHRLDAEMSRTMAKASDRQQLTARGLKARRSELRRDGATYRILATNLASCSARALPRR